MRKEGRLTWPAAEGGDNGQNAHDTQVRDPGCVVLQESSRWAGEEAAGLEDLVPTPAPPQSICMT